MDWAGIQTTLITLAASAIVTILGKWLGLKRAEEARSAVTWALEQGVALAAAKYKDARHAGEVKKGEAITVAQSLAPKAMQRLKPEQTDALVEATYARLRPSLPHASTHRTHAEDIPVDVVEVVSGSAGGLSERPTPLPPLRGPVGPGAKGTPPG